MAISEPWTLKRLAWAYGCSGKGSSEESSLRRDLEERILEGRDPTLCKNCGGAICPACEPPEKEETNETQHS